MKTPVTTFNGWMLNKIVGYLAQQDGCRIVYRLKYTHEGAKAVFQDSLGFIYEVSIQTTGRVTVDQSDVHMNPKTNVLERVK